MQFPYVTIGVNDPQKAHAFYDATLSTIGWSSHATFGDEWRAYSKDGKGEGFIFWVCTPFDSETATVGNGSMLALPAGSQAEVDAFYTAALAHGGADEGPPGLRQIYTPTWYAAYMRDPSGNKLAVVHAG
jgi:catechol 2,3-dioxygenase-like lactoylglutathione lyase family enzyme